MVVVAMFGLMVILAALADLSRGRADRFSFSDLWDEFFAGICHNH